MKLIEEIYPELMGIPKYRRYEKRIPQKSVKPFEKRIVLISDTHISTENNSCFNHTMFRKGIEEISRIRNVDYILHLGDLTHDGTYLEYQIAQDLMRRINKDNFYIIPGNHDARNVGYLLFEEFFGARQFVIDDPNIFILGIDSSIPDENPGLVGKVALQRSEDDFLLHGDKLKMLCFHHQTIPIPHTGRERSAIYDGGDVLEMALRTNVNLILNGHRHITNIYSCTDGDTDLILFNSGTLSANKTRYREMFSYTILDLNEKMVKFTTKRLLDDSFKERRRHLAYNFKQPKIHDEIPESIIIHLGNTHFGEKLFLPEVFSMGVQQINQVTPDLIVLTGSLTGSNLVEEYSLAKEKLKEFSSPHIVLPGFKDLKKYGWDHFGEYIGSMNPIFNSDTLRVRSLNTVNPHLTHGSVGRRRMTEICEKFRSTDDLKKNIIALNHRLIPSPRLKFDQILEDSGGVLKNFTLPRNQINLILNGRNNIGFSLQLEETVLSFCGSFSSRNTVSNHHHSFNIIEFYKNGLVRLYEHHIEENTNQLIGQYWQ